MAQDTMCFILKLVGSEPNMHARAPIILYSHRKALFRALMNLVVASVVLLWHLSSHHCEYPAEKNQRTTLREGSVIREALGRYHKLIITNATCQVSNLQTQVSILPVSCRLNVLLFTHTDKSLCCCRKENIEFSMCSIHWSAWRARIYTQTHTTVRI